MRAYAPTGALIYGTLERMYGVAFVASFTKEEGGEIKVKYSGESDVDLDSQETVLRDDQRIFVDVDGKEWLESEIQFRREEG